jgi:hypothetical protein
MTPIKETLPGWYTIDARHYLFWQNWPTLKAHATGPPLRSRIRLAFFPPSPLPCVCPEEPP